MATSNRVPASRRQLTRLAARFGSPAGAAGLVYAVTSAGIANTPVLLGLMAYIAWQVTALLVSVHSFDERLNTLEGLCPMRNRPTKGGQVDRKDETVASGGGLQGCPSS